MRRASRKHLSEVNETYSQHLRFALIYAFGCLQAALMATIHGLIPGLFKTAASDKVKNLANQTRPPKPNEHE